MFRAGFRQSSGASSDQGGSGASSGQGLQGSGAVFRDNVREGSGRAFRVGSGSRHGSKLKTIWLRTEGQGSGTVPLVSQ